MKIDLTRDTFRADNHFLRVRMQQGRVQIDADANERDDLFWHHIWTLAADLAGPNWGPGYSFRVALNPYDKTLLLHPGRYYAQSLPAELANIEPIGTVENATVTLKKFPPEGQKLPVGRRATKEKEDAKFTLDENGAKGVLISLHVCEELVTYIEEGRIREVALDSADTAARTRLVWWIEGRGDIDPARALYFKVAWKQARYWLSGKIQSAEEDGRLAARAAKKVDDGPCVLAPEARYRGLENQLYRVEIIGEGTTLEAEKEPKPDQGTPRFAWSRDNGSVVAPIKKFQSKKEVVIDATGREGLLGFAAGDWVELTNGELENQSQPGRLVKLQSVEGPLLKLVEDVDDAGFKKVRRWDTKGANPTAFLAEAGRWLPLEDGVEIRFEPGKFYKAGSYWLIPARTALGDVEWDQDNGQPKWEPPRRPRCFEAPLALIYKPKDKPIEVVDLRTPVPRTALVRPPKLPILLDNKLLPKAGDGTLQVPHFRLVGVGYQKYKPGGNPWQAAVDHEVMLFDEQGAFVGRHYQNQKAGDPNVQYAWEALDGSKAVSVPGTVKVPAGEELEHLMIRLDEATKDTFGLFGKITIIQRVATGWLAPLPAAVGETKEVNRPFLATYYCYGQP